MATELALYAMVTNRHTWSKTEAHDQVSHPSINETRKL